MPEDAMSRDTSRNRDLGAGAKPGGSGMRVIVPALALLTGTLAAALPVRAAEPAAAGAQDWPQWRGPSLTGSAAPDANPPTEWGPDKNVRWKVKLPGSGLSTPIIAGDRIFIQTAIPAGSAPAAAADGAAEPEGTAAVVNVLQQQRGRGQGRGGRGGRGGFGGGAPPTTPFRFVLMCLDRKTGKTLWEQTARELIPHEGHHGDHGFSSHSPVTDGTHVWAFFGSRGLHCYDLDGNRKWEKDLGKQQTRAGFGEGSSPALHGDTVVVNWDHEGADFVVAFDKLTGDEKWRQPRDEPTTWTTPLVVEHEGKAQVVVSGTNRIRSYDLATGKQVWECGGMTQNVIPTPVAGDGMVFVTSGFRGHALLAIKLGREGDLTNTDAIAWRIDRDTPYVASPVLADGKLYFFADRGGQLSCYDAKTGKPLIQAKRIEAIENVYASPIAAGGRLYLSGRDGAVVVVRHAGDKLEELAVNDLGEGIDASPAVVGNELYLRGRQHLYCIAEK
jgi:outer membrane protein assembly factor BamB